MRLIESATTGSARGRRGRHLTWWQFVLLAVVYVAIIQGSGLILGSGISADATLETTGNFVRVLLIPIVLSSVFVISLATWLGWWPEIIHEENRVQGWVRIVPILLVLAAVAGASWGNLFSQEASLVVVFVVFVLIVGFTEELMFRGVGLVTFRRGGYSEVKVALFTSIIFGAAHLSNAISTGPKALIQAAVVSLTGYLFYLTRRRAGIIWIAMPVHSSQDFALLSAQIGVDPAAYVGGVLIPLAMLALAIILWRRRHRIELPPVGVDSPAQGSSTAQ